MPRPRVIHPAKSRRPRTPDAAAMTLASRLHARIDRVRAFVRTRIVDEWGTNARAHGPQPNPRHHGPTSSQPEERTDASRSSWVEERLRALAAEQREDDPTATIELVASRVVKKNGEELKRLIPISLRKDPHLAPLLDGFRADSLRRIRSLDEDQVDELREVLEEAEREGWLHEDLADAIEQRLEVSESRADTIARTQTLQFNAAVTKERHRACGIERFIWSTSGDERVRESHEELDGEEFAYDDLPEVDGEHVMPGEPINCWCVSIPVLPLIEDLEDDEAAVGAEDLPIAAE